MRIEPLLVLLACWPAVDPSDKAREVVQKLQGTWIAVALERDGQKADEAEVKKTRFIIRGDKMGSPPDVGGPELTFRVDPAAVPSRIDLMEGQQTIRGIYKLDGDRLEICIRLATDGKYPSEFTGLKGHALIDMRRGKPADEVPPRPAVEANAVAAIQKTGGRVEIDEQKPGRPVVAVHFGPKTADADLAELKAFPKLASLELYMTGITDRGLEQVNGLTGLQKLNLSQTKVTDAGLEHLKGLTELAELTLSRTDVTDAGLKHLQGLTGLRRLILYRTKVTDRGMSHLRGLTGLKDLWLWDTTVGDEGLAHLEGLTALEKLHLGSTPVTDAGLKHLSKMVQLRELNLGSTQVTDGSATLLQALPGLRKLNLA